MGKREDRFRPSIVNILIMRSGALGDFILTLPVIESLRAAFPSARIMVMGNPDFSGLAYHLVDGFISQSLPGLYTLYGEHCKIPDHITKELKYFDLVITYSSDKEGVLVGHLEKIGVPWILTGGVHSTEAAVLPATDQLLLPLVKEGIPVSLRSPQVMVSSIKRQYAREFFRSSCGVRSMPAPRVGFHPGSGSRKKCWPVKKFVELMKWTKRKFNATIVLLSGPADREVTEDILAQADDCKLILVKDLPLTSVAAVLEQCSCYVGNDSGVTHLAAAVGTSTLALFGPTDSRVWSPRNENAQVVQSLYTCSPCSPQQMAQCSQPACMESITLAAVQQRLDDFLGADGCQASLKERTETSRRESNDA
ncbi:MAG: glycosyltransferase family 9 protein [Deltaproteobacteria bacterium]|nr:glycosyltransferase family 9 protein [Deltaproteobacteria bacterium]